MRTTPTRSEALGMLEALTASHRCGQACNGTVALGDGSHVQLSCPYDRLDLDNPADRRIVAGMYASEARAAM
jgi:hypothetical protein